MALANATLVTITGTYTRLDGRAAKGQVFFSSDQVLVDSTSGEIVPPVDFVATLDANGAISIDLPATDDPDYEPQGWTYTVTEDTDGGDRPPFGLSVPADGGAIDLADVAPPGPTEGLTADEYTLLSTFTSHRSAWGGDPPAGSADDLLGLDANNVPKVVPGDTYLKRYVEDVTNHGAVLDNTTVDAPAVQAAVDALNGARGIVLVPGHAYCGDTSIDAKRARIMGLGVPDNSGGGGGRLRFDAPAGVYSSVEANQGYSLSDIEVLGDNGGTPTASGQVAVDFTGQNYPRLWNVYVRRAEVGVKLANGTSVECHYGRFFGVDLDSNLRGWDFDTTAHDHSIYGGRNTSTTGALIVSNVNRIAFYGHAFEGFTDAIDSTGYGIGVHGVRFESAVSGATALQVRSGAGRHWYDGATVFSAPTDVNDANSPTVVFGVGVYAGGTEGLENRLDDLKTNEDLYVGEGTQAEDRVLHIAGPSGQVRDLRIYSGDPEGSGTLRWIWRVNNASETGSNVGSNFALMARSDTGGVLGTYLSIQRSDGATRLNGSKIGFLGAAAVAQQTGPAALTDNSGGTTDDAIAAVSGSGADAAINDNFAELAQDVEQLRTALKNFGLIS